MKNVIKVQLRPNLLTDDLNDFLAVVVPQGHMNLENIVDELIAEGTEFARETLIDIVGRYNRMCAKYAVIGYDVDTGLVYLRPVVRGVFHDKTYDPAKDSIYVLATQSKDLREEIAETHVEITGEAPSVMDILKVENLATQATDGTLKRGRNARITGSYIKLAGTEPGVGVFFITADGATSYKLTADCIAVNDPSTLVLLIPDSIPAGAYRLKIVTQYSPHKLLTTSREATYRNVLTLI
jgi:hypothetical protein